MGRQEIIIRSMTPDDVATCALWVDGHALFRPYGFTSAKLAPLLRDALQRGDGLLTAEDATGTSGDALLGLAWFLPRGTFYSGAYLRLLLVAPQETGVGVGSRLMTAAEAIVFEQGRDFFLMVNTRNRKAQRFYEARGYSRIGRINDYVAPGVHEYLYYKRREPQLAP